MAKWKPNKPAMNVTIRLPGDADQARFAEAACEAARHRVMKGYTDTTVFPVVNETPTVGDRSLTAWVTYEPDDSQEALQTKIHEAFQETAPISEALHIGPMLLSTYMAEKAIDDGIRLCLKRMKADKKPLMLTVQQYEGKKAIPKNKRTLFVPLDCAADELKYTVKEWLQEWWEMDACAEPVEYGMPTAYSEGVG